MNIYSSPFYPSNLRFDMWEAQEKAAIPTYMDGDHCFTIDTDCKLKTSHLDKKICQQILNLKKLPSRQKAPETKQ